MKSFLKPMLVAGALVASLTALQSEAQAEPLVSSYYGYELAGSPTASGEPFDPAGYTAASLTYPLGTQL
ncbi:MAG: septal ring lytic transglycosylase RlpA family protein, partial [Rubrobacteraceae bacterium]